MKKDTVLMLYDKDENIINMFETVKHAAEYLNCTTNAIYLMIHVGGVYKNGDKIMWIDIKGEEND